ncbi:hypothetical protein Drorol1_Dr00018737 [Drosera rotundifolia]
MTVSDRDCIHGFFATKSGLSPRFLQCVGEAPVLVFVGVAAGIERGLSSGKRCGALRVLRVDWIRYVGLPDGFATQGSLSYDVSEKQLWVCGSGIVRGVRCDELNCDLVVDALIPVAGGVECGLREWRNCLGS